MMRNSFSVRFGMEICHDLATAGSLKANLSGSLGFPKGSFGII